MSGGLKSCRGRRNSGSSGHFSPLRGIGVTASTSVFQTESVRAALAYRTIFVPEVYEAAHHFAKVEDRGASPRGNTTFHIPLWPTQQGTRLVNEIMRARIPPGDPFSRDRSVIAAFDSVKVAERGQNPPAPPFWNDEGQNQKLEFLRFFMARTVKPSSHPAATRTYLVRVQSAPPFLVCSLRVKHGAHNPGDAGSSPAGPTSPSVRWSKRTSALLPVGSRTDCALTGAVVGQNRWPPPKLLESRLQAE